MSNFMKIRPVAAELFHADKQNEANSRFSQFYESAQNDPKVLCCPMFDIGNSITLF